MFAGMQSYAQQASYSGGLMNGGPPSPAAMGAVSPPPPPATLMGVMRGYGGYSGGPSAGAYGEAMAGQMMGGARMGAGIMGAGIAGVGALGSLGVIGGGWGAAASMLDPMGMALRAGSGAFGMAGGGFGGLAAGMGAAGMVAAPLYAGVKYAGALASNFQGGMQDQMALNANLRQNFNFMGGQGAYGRGFNQSQMGQIGGLVGAETRSNPFTSAGELNSLIAGGAQMGTFSGVRDVQEFSTRFKAMIATLKTVQKELGGNLQEAQDFVNQSRQAGVFGSTQATRFAATIRNTSAVTGMDQGALMQLSSQGAQIARSFGGYGRQGAAGAMAGVTSISTMMQRGMVDEETLSAATGGLTGQDAMNQFTLNMMQKTGRRARSAHGRYSIFGLANAEGTGLDEAALMQFQMGDMGVGNLSRRAHRRVNRMGRAEAMDHEGELRGAAMEQGGVGFQIGMMRQLLGGREGSMNDALVSQVLQRRGGLNRDEATIMTARIRNQGTLVQAETSDRIASRREGEMRTDIREHRSLDAFQREIGHTISNELGLTKAREMGRKFVTDVSSSMERAMNQLLGIADTSMSNEVRQRMSRLAVGAGSAHDMAIAQRAFAGQDMGPRVRGMETFNKGIFEIGPSRGEAMEAAGFNVSGYGGGDTGRVLRELGGTRRQAQMTAAQVEQASGLLSDAQSGRVTGAAAGLRQGMGGANESLTRRRVLEAQLAATGRGQPNQWMSAYAGIDREGHDRLTSDMGLALTAFSANEGISNPLRMSNTRLQGAGQARASGANSLWEGFRELAYSKENLARVRAQEQGQEVEVTANEYFGAGGAAAEGLKTQAEAIRQNRGGIERRNLTADQRNQMALNTDARAEMLSHVDPAAMAAATQDPGVREASELLLSDDPEKQREGLDRLSVIEGSKEAGSAGRLAMSSLRENAQRLLEGPQRDKAQLRAAFSRVVLPREEQEQMIREAGLQRQNFQANARTYATDSPVRRMFEAAAGNGAGGGYASIQTNIDEMALMSDEAFGARMAEMGEGISGQSAEGQDMTRGLMQQATAAHGQARDIMGHGRRGARGGREAAMNMATGGMLGNMRFNIGGQRVGGRNAADMLLGGGRHSGEMMKQLQQQMRAMGVSESAARDITGTLTSVYARGNAPGQRGEHGEEVSATEMQQLQRMQKNHGDVFRNLQQQGHDRAMSQANARDPVGAETNRILGEINTGIGKLAAGDPSAPRNPATDPAPQAAP